MITNYVMRRFKGTPKLDWEPAVVLDVSLPAGLEPTGISYKPLMAARAAPLSTSVDTKLGLEPNVVSCNPRSDTTQDAQHVYAVLAMLRQDS